MNNTKIEIGCNYELTGNYGKHLKKGDIVKACYYGEFVLTIVENSKLTNKEIYTPTGCFLRAIKNGKAVLINN